MTSALSPTGSHNTKIAAFWHLLVPSSLSICGASALGIMFNNPQPLIQGLAQLEKETSERLTSKALNLFK